MENYSFSRFLISQDKSKIEILLDDIPLLIKESEHSSWKYIHEEDGTIIYELICKFNEKYLNIFIENIIEQLNNGIDRNNLKMDVPYKEIKKLNIDFNTITEFENKIAKFFGAPYAVAVDCCTHGIELCLRYVKADYISVPYRTYLSIPFLAYKLNIPIKWKDKEWEDYYYVTDNIIDAAVLWKPNSYVKGAFMNISFQYQKHLSLGRGGIILLDNKEAAEKLKKMSYDGRLSNIPWRNQNINSIGYHYYMTPEIAQLGLDKLNEAIATEPRKWVVEDWPDLTEMNVFKKQKDD